MMKTTPTPSFVVPQTEFLLQFLVVPLDDPAMFGHVHRFHKSDISRQGGWPVFGWFGFTDGHSMSNHFSGCGSARS
jgi:hypothetical protein